MALISFDNGTTFFGPEDADEIREGIEEVGWETIVERMDDETRERCNMESDATEEAEWLCDYLRMADWDLVIG